MRIVQMTDTHVRASGVMVNEFVDSNAMFARAVLATAKLDPDCVLISGDLTDCGLPEEYAQLRALLAPLTMPVYLIPGNHDRRENLRAATADWDYFPDRDQDQYYVIDSHPVRLIGLDTVVPGAGHGQLDPEQLAWLEQTLRAEPDKPTVIFMHHPPFATGLTGMDRINCHNGADLEAVVRAHPQIERVLCGHHHRPIQVRWAGTLGSVAPNTAHQVLMDFGDNEERIVMEPPALHVHVYRTGAGIVSHHSYVDDCGGPREFILDPDYPGQ